MHYLGELGLLILHCRIEWASLLGIALPCISSFSAHPSGRPRSLSESRLLLAFSGVLGFVVDVFWGSSLGRTNDIQKKAGGIPISLLWR